MDFSTTYLDYSWINLGYFSSFIAKYFVVIWCFVFVYSVHDISWALTVWHCALLWSAVSLGYSLGISFYSNYIGRLSELIIHRWAYLSILLLLLATITKFSIILFLCTIIGLIVGSTISSISRHLRNRTFKSNIIDNPNIIDDITLLNMKYKCLSLSFCPLLIILLYDTSYDSKFPTFLPALFYSWIFFIFLIIYSKLYEYCYIILSYFGINIYNNNNNINNIDININENNNNNNNNNMNQNNKLIKIEPYNGKLPKLFLSFHNNNEIKAREAFNKMLQWRQDNNIDEILTTYQPYFNEILQNYPHYIHGRSKDNCIIVYECVGKANLENLKSIGMTIDQMVHHFTLRNELLAKKYLNMNYSLNNRNSFDLLNQKESLQCISILDCAGIAVEKVSFVDIISFILKSSFIVDNYYPGLVQRILIINASYAFQYAWSIASSVLPAAIKQKLSFPSLDGLNEFIDSSQRPKIYNGTDLLNLGESEEHLTFINLPTTWKKNDTNIILNNSKNNHNINNMDLKDEYIENIDIHDNKENNENNNKNKGILSKIFNLFKNKNNESNNNQLIETNLNIKPTKAHLGNKLNFVFDKILNQWIESDNNNNEDDENNSDNDEEKVLLNKNKNKNKQRTNSNDSITSEEFFDSKESIDNNNVNVEDDVILAIEAAHFAKSLINKDDKTKISNHNIFNATNHHYTTMNNNNNNNGLSIRVGKSNNNNSNNNNNNEIKNIKNNVNINHSPPTIQLLICILFFQFITSIIFYGILFILPAYSLTPSKRGGLNYALIDMSLIISCIGMLLYTFGLSMLQPKCNIMLRISPVRALRISIGILLISCILFTVLCSSRKINIFSEQDLEKMIEVDDWTSMHPDYLKSNILSPFNLNSINNNNNNNKDNNNWTFYSFIMLPWKLLNCILYHTPSDSIFGLIIPSILATIILCSSYMSKRATILMSYSTLLQSTFDSSSFISLYKIIDNIAAIIGPIIMAFCFSNTYHLHLNYPRDASYTIYVIIAIAMFIYICTLLIHVQFRGDFGILIDQDITNRTNDEINNINNLNNTLNNNNNNNDNYDNNKYNGKKSFNEKFDTLNANNFNPLQPYRDNTFLYVICGCCQLCCTNQSTRKLYEIINGDIQLLKSTFSNQHYAFPIMQQLRNNNNTNINNINNNINNRNI